CSREEHGGEKAAACTDWIRWWHSQSGWASEEISNARGKETPCHSGQRPPRVHSDPAPHPCSNWTWRKEPYAIPGTKNILDCKCKHCCTEGSLSLCDLQKEQRETWCTKDGYIGRA